jgi:hypothetical protein
VAEVEVVVLVLVLVTIYCCSLPWVMKGLQK